MEIIGEIMFDFHERSDVALGGQKWWVAHTCRDGKELDVQTR